MTATVFTANKGGVSRRAIFITTRKGGVGKTKDARLLGEMHRESGADTLLVDADKAVGQFLKHLGERGVDGSLLDPQPIETGVLAIDWHNDVRARDAIGEVLSHGKHVIIDMPGGSLDGLCALDEEAGYMDILAASGYEATFISPITPWVETWADALKIRIAFPNAAQLLVVNQDFGDDEDFADWNESDTRAHLLEAGSREIVLPSLRSGIAAKIAKNRLRYHHAAQSPALTVIDRGRVTKWLAAATASLAVHADILGLPEVGE